MLMKRAVLLAVTGSVALGTLALGAQPLGSLGVVPSEVEGQNPATDWPAVAGDVGGMKYSPANQITPANVTTLTQAWTYAGNGAAPIVINNLMYFVSGGSVVALNADTGTEAWKFPL